MLNNELTNDPLGRGYATMTDEEVAASLNTPDRVVGARVPTKELIKYMGSTGAYSKISERRNDPAPAKRAPAITIMDFVMNPHLDDIDVNDTAFLLGIDALIAEGDLTVANKSAILAMGSKTISRAEELGLGRVRVGHVQEAR